MDVLYQALADAVMVVHLAFIVFIAAGGLLAWRWPKLVWVHLPAVAWGVGIITIGYECPLTPLEKFFMRRAGDDAYAGGFVDRYVEGVIYPEELTPVLRGVAAAAVVVGYAGLLYRRGGTLAGGLPRRNVSI